VMGCADLATDSIARSEIAYMFGRAVTEAGMASTHIARVRMLECMIALLMISDLGREEVES
jgi:hypothetical protein